jgi:Ca-activated chloride channel family protein
MLRRLQPVLIMLSLLPLATPGPTPTLAQEDLLSASTKTVNVALILDASGSMAEALPDGETRMAAAKRILRGVIEGLPERDGVNVGPRVHSHLGDNTESGKPVSCRSSSTTLVQLLVRQGHRYHVEDTVDVMIASDRGGALPERA